MVLWTPLFSAIVQSLMTVGHPLTRIVWFRHRPHQQRSRYVPPLCLGLILIFDILQFSFNKRRPIQERTQSLQLPHSYSWYSNDSRRETASPSRLSPAPVVVRNLDRNLDQRTTIRDHVSSASSSSGRRHTYRISSKHAYGVVLAPDLEEDTSTIYSDNTQAEPLPHLNSQGYNRQWETNSYTPERTPRHQQSFTSTASNETRSLGQSTSAQLVVVAFPEMPNNKWNGGRKSIRYTVTLNEGPNTINRYTSKAHVARDNCIFEGEDDI